MTSQTGKAAQTEADSAADSPEKETLEAFKASFAYGSRTDLLFKFMGKLSEQDAAEFLRGLLEKLGHTINDGGTGRLFEHVYEWLVQAYLHEQHDQWSYEDGPFTPLKKPLAACRLGLLSTTGHFVEGDDPEPFGEKNMTQEQAIPRIVEFVRSEPKLSTVPLATPRDKLRVRHPGYDIRGVVKDYNVALPLDRLAECVEEGLIGELLPDAFSFVGATAQIPLLKKQAPRWVAMLKERAVDAMLLVPV